MYKPHRKPVPPPLPEPHGLRPGQTITLDGHPATITGVANQGGYYRVGVQIDGVTIQLYARPNGTLMPQAPTNPAPLKADRLFLSGAIK